MMHHSVSKVVVYLRTAQLTGLLVNFLLGESVLKKKGGVGGDSLQGILSGWPTTAEKGLPTGWPSGFTAEGKHVQAQREVNIQYVDLQNTQQCLRFCGTCFIIYVCCVPVQRREYSEMLNRNSDTVYVRVEVGETHTPLLQCEPFAPLTHPSPTHSLTPSPWLSAAPVHLRTGRPGAEDAGRLRNQAEEAGLQGSAVAPGDDHGAAEGLPGAQWHRDQGGEITRHMSRPKTQRESCCWLRLADFSLPTHQTTLLFFIFLFFSLFRLCKFCSECISSKRPEGGAGIYYIVTVAWWQERNTFQ